MSFKVNSSLLTMPAIPAAINFTTALTCNAFITQWFFSESPNTKKETKDCRFTQLPHLVCSQWDFPVSHSLGVRFSATLSCPLCIFWPVTWSDSKDTYSSRTCPPNCDGMQRGRFNLISPLGQGSLERSDVTCARFVSAPYSKNRQSDSENSSYTYPPQRVELHCQRPIIFKAATAMCTEFVHVLFFPYSNLTLAFAQQSNSVCGFKVLRRYLRYFLYCPLF